MIINTGQRTDILAFYAPWFLKRLEEGFVDVRNPYYPSLVTRYSLDPNLVDCLAFCSKNPGPFVPYLDKLKVYPGVYFYITITPYGKDIEPGVPDKHQAIENFKTISQTFGLNSVGWRYDPILINERYTVEQHIRSFTKMATLLKGYTKTAVISFVDLYPKVKKNFPELKEVNEADRTEIVRAFVKIANDNGMDIVMCHESEKWDAYGAITTGCMTTDFYEKAVGEKLRFPAGKKGAREGCACFLSNDIGAYDSCLHLCKYCYANSSKENILKNHELHDPNSSFLIGGPLLGDKLVIAKQESWREKQITLF